MKIFGGQSDVYHLSFNQDFSCIAIGSRNGFSIYNLEPIEMRFSHTGEGFGCIEMLYCTSLLALVGAGDQPGSSPRKFRLWNAQSQEIICEITFPSTILNVVMNRERVVVCLETQLHVYDLATMKCLQVLSTPPNSRGLAALSTESSSYLIFPSGTGGNVVIYDCMALCLVSQIDAHKTAVVALQFDSSGSLLATASATGTVIRLFSIPSGNHLCTFRRGSRASSICSISFSSDSAMLAVASSSGTVHLFDVESALRKLVAPQSLPPGARGGSSGSGGSSLEKGRAGSMGGETAESGEGHDGVALSESSYALPGSSASARGMGSWATSAMTYISLAQSWGMAAVGGLGQAVLPEPVHEYAESIRAVALARLPPSTIQTGGGFVAGVVPTGSGSCGGEESTPQEEAERAFKIVVITQRRQLFRYAVPRNMAELTEMQRKGDEVAVVECTLEDEALLE